MSKNTLVLKFDPNTIQHLGVSLYSQLPSVLAELISNSWDADADNVTIEFCDTGRSKSIIYKDDGIGMTFDELNEKYLMIGRNRRKDEPDATPKGRKVIGKKGLGKLSIFGICDEIQVKTIKDGILNEFVMKFSDIKNSSSTTYNPEILKQDVSTEESSGTELFLRQMRRKTPFEELPTVAQSLAKRFLVFDTLKTNLSNGNEILLITNESKFDGFNEQFKWKLPLDTIDSDYVNARDISGSIITLKTPIKDTEMKGIYLTSRGKVVNRAEFYGLRDTDLFHSYVTGYLNVDFIDEEDEDLISTDRQSLNWENEKAEELQKYLQKLILKIGAEWRAKRGKLKQEEIRNQKGIDVSIWQGELPTYEKELSERIINPILENSNIDVEESSQLIGNVIDQFENKSFKEYASRIADISTAEEIPKLLKLMNEWKTIESRQYCDLAVSRIEVINKFENYIGTDTNEVPTLHNFLKKFSWLLDPRILEFRDEVTYSKLLRETYPDETLDIQDRRIDFLCSNALGGILYVIEIKRSKYRVDMKALDQAWGYASFLRSRYASETGFSKVVSFVIGGEKSTDYDFVGKENTYRQSGEVFVKTYTELLEQSKEYHREFIEVYQSHQKPAS
jgi:hypothetical protein